MKRTLTTLLLPLLMASAVFAQSQKPKYGKTYPQSIEFSEKVSTSESRALFQEYLQLKAEDELRTLKTEEDLLGFKHEKYQQYYMGVEVDGATYTVHSKNGDITSMTGDYRNVVDLSVVPLISASTALENAISYIGAESYVWEAGNPLATPEYQFPEGKLVVVAHPEGKQAPRLAYKFDIYASDPLYRAWVYIDAHTGAFIQEFHRIHDTNVSATGNSLYNGNVSFTADFNGSIYQLQQTSSGNGVQTFNMNNGTNYGAATNFTSSTSNFTNDDTGVQAHWGAERTHAYFLQEHNRNSYNGAGAIIKSYVHYSSNYVNAFWDGIRMTYGDGDGVSYGPLVSLDICGHEITHGVTEYTANLVYSYQSGALNESFSDIFGECIENFATGSNDWLMGDQIGIGGSGAIRSMSNPNQFNDPDTYLGTYWYTGTGDNGGVHINSGVQNKWFYILTVGESGTNDLGNSYNVTGIGMTNAAKIAYRNLSVYLTSSSNYAAARAGSIQAAKDLFGVGSAEEIATTNAWYAVGVGAAWAPPAPCVGGSVTLSITLDNYPTETTWNLKTAGGTTIASGGPYASGQAGTTVTQNFTLSGDDYVFTINDSYGDGICCAYGNGSYSLVSGGTTIVSGGAFGSTEATNFCVETAAPTCNDGIQNGDETGVDCGGSTCPACPTCNDGIQNGDETGVDCGGSTCPPCGGGGSTVLSAHYFETGWDGWADGGSDCARYSGPYSWEGSYSIRLRDNSGVASSMTSSSYNLSGFSSVEVEFYFYAYSMEYGEDFWLRYNDGSGWQTVAAYAAGSSFNNNTFYVATVTLSSANYNLSSNASFRFQCDASANADQIYIDAVTITGISGGTFMAGQSSQRIEAAGPAPDEDEQAGFLSHNELESVIIYPNPASNRLNIQSAGNIRSVRIIALNGQVLMQDEVMSQGNSLDISSLKAGFYLVTIETDTGVVNKKFVKQ